MVREREERTILVGAFLKRGRTSGGPFRVFSLTEEDVMDELEALARGAGARVVEKVLVRTDRFNPSTLVGSGKVEEIHSLVHRHDADAVVFYNLLKPGQQRQLEDALGVKVIDRKELILDIFAQRAQTKEGKLQVELAQLNYRLTRIVGKGVQLSRTGGGIGTRGPGEKKLEVDRRRIRERIAQIKRELEKVRRTRSLHYAGRKRRGNPVVSLVGYTNAGKSTLFNRLTESSVTSRDQLFSTLDPTTRRVKTGGGDSFLLVDTVGFIRDLPPELIESFKATLEGILEADLIVHVVDAASPFSQENREVVESILREIGAGNRPIITVYNKCDLIDRSLLRSERKNGDFYVSAKTGDGVGELVQRIREMLCRENDTGTGSTRKRSLPSQTS
ncbi:MAG: GTPase HflX [Deltaproteobacteria bacterium]|nr:MAG: GTPase HflX [Deltaproteobacteria bacterium]